MCCHYGSTRSSNCCLSALVFSAAARWAKFFLGNFRPSLKAQEVTRSNVSQIVGRGGENVFVRCSIWTLSPWCDHCRDNNDSRGCVLQRASIVLSGKTLLLLLLSGGASVVTWNLPQNYSFLLMSASFSWLYCVWDNLRSAGKGKQSCRVYTSVNECSHIHRNTNDPGVRLDYYKSGL